MDRSSEADVATNTVSGNSGDAVLVTRNSGLKAVSTRLDAVTLESAWTVARAEAGGNCTGLSRRTRAECGSAVVAGGAGAEDRAPGEANGVE